MADFLSKLWGAPEPVRPLTPSFAYTVPTSISQQTDEEEPLLVDDLEELVAPRTDPPRKKLSQSDLSKSEISLTRTWSPYRNLLVFLCTILLWHRPVALVGLCVLSHVTLWYGAKLVMFYNVWYLVANLLGVLLCADYICHTRHITWDTFLALFPHETNERVSYFEIVQQFASLKKFASEQWRRAAQFREEQSFQFLISGLFFNFLILFFLSLFKVFTLIYFSVFTLLLLPGLWHHNMLLRVYRFLFPVVVDLYNKANDRIVDLISQKPSSSAPTRQQPEQRPLIVPSTALPPSFGREGSPRPTGTPQRLASGAAAPQAPGSPLTRPAYLDQTYTIPPADPHSFQPLHTTEPRKRYQ